MARKPARKPTKPAPKKGAPKKGERTRPDWAPKFLAALAVAANITEACHVACVNRDAFYERRKRDAQFLAATRQAMATAIEALEREMWRRALEGTREPVTSGGKLAYCWVDKEGNHVAPVIDEAGNETAPAGARLVPLLIRKYSDTLAIFLAKAHKPKKYRERYQVDHTGKVRHQVGAEDLTDEQLAQIARGEPKPGGRGAPPPAAGPQRPA
jgi:hypothetical protein